MTRRDAMILAGSTAILADPRSLAAATRELHGTVFHDRSGGGVRRAGDPGIGGALVSNGVDVVATDADGRWRLPVSPGGHVFLVQPTGWKASPKANGLPGFAGFGRPAFAAPVEFPLRPSAEPRQFSVALLADTQPQDARELGYLRDCFLGPVSESGAAFAINHGDVVFDDLGLYPRYLELVRATGMPWHHCPGNHDMDWDAQSPEQSFETWRRVFGPCHYAFQHGGSTFILLNNVEPLPSGERTKGGYGYRGRIGPAQLAFVRNLLTHVHRNALVVVSMHIPLVALETPDEPSGFTKDCHELLRLLSGRPSTLSLAGHTHTTEHHYLGCAHGFSGPGLHHHHVLTAASGGWWSGPFDACGLPVAHSRDGTPKGFHVLSVDGDTYATRFVPVGHTGDPKVRISIEGRRHRFDTSDEEPYGRAKLGCAITMEERRGAVLVANVFDGGPRTSVTCELIGPGENSHVRIGMQRRDMPDPYIAEAYRRFKPELKPWLEPAVSSHVWTVPLPADLPSGPWRARVHIVDEYGQPHTSSLLFEIVL